MYRLDIERQTNYVNNNWGIMGGYDSDRYDDGDGCNESNSGWVDYGLGYRGNYKANYGSSPWSGNNDD